MGQTSLTVISVVLFCALLGALGQLFFKLASRDVTVNPIDWLKNWKFLFGAGLYAFSAILFVWSLKNGNLSTLYPVIATSYIWVAIFSVGFLGESFPLFKWIGILLILVGIAIVVR
jgi:drug/metabolite transporter (DMT)-like permease